MIGNRNPREPKRSRPVFTGTRALTLTLTMVQTLILFTPPRALAQFNTGFNSMPSVLSPQTLFQHKTIYIETQISEPTEGLVRFRVRNQVNGNYSIINLQKLPSSTNTWFGYFSIPILPGDQGERILEFFNPQGNKLFVFSDRKETVPGIYLFPSAAKREEFARQFKRSQVPTPEANPMAKVPETPKTPPVDPVALAALKAKQEEAVRMIEQQQELARVNIEEQMALERERKRKEQEALNKAEKKRRKDQAVKIAAEAFKEYRSGNYTQAVDLYEKASEMDPENDTYYYKYGVALYKINNYNKSLAMLSLAEDPDLNQNEKAYYIGLNHMKLKEYDKARKEFSEIREENDPTLSPMAAFFAANIEIQQQKYPEARKNLEYTLDHSQDPSIDKAAENLLEEVDRLENYMASQKERFRITLSFSMINDSNVLNIAQNNLNTGTEAYRANYGLTLLTNLYRTPDSELGIQLAANDYYSVNKQFSKDATIQATDPLIYTATLPFKGQWKIGEKNLLYEITPTYTSTVMNPDGTTRRQILSSTGGNANVTWPIKQDLITQFKIDQATDRSYLESAENDNQGNQHYTINWTFTKLMDLKGERSLTFDLSTNKNNAIGKNNRYDRNKLSLSYAFPGPWKSNDSVKLDYTNQKFLEPDTPRTDSIWALTVGGSKDLQKNLNFAVNLQATNANSLNTTYTYDKYVLTLALTHTTSIQRK